MEDDDEFGDLYTDVLKPFASSQAPPPALKPKEQSSVPPPPLPSSFAPEPSRRPIDLNLKISDDDRITSPALKNPILAPAASDSGMARGFEAVGLASSSHRVSVPSFSVEFPKSSFKDAKLQIAVQESKGADSMDVDVKFDIEEADAGPDDGSLIPGVSGSRQTNGGDDWDSSDSEDELQIVLNENPSRPIGMFGDDDDDEDDPLVIVTDEVPNQPAEGTDWGEHAGETGQDGERKDGGGSEAGKTTGPVTGAPKVGYSSHGYHPFHSQFKYVRPGAAPMPGSNTAGPGGASTQGHPPTNMGLMAGRGRGEWRPAGLRPAFQKSYQGGFGGPAWGSGRGFGGGLDFTLPSHKTIFEVDIDSFEEKPWKHPGVDMTDFFNFGLNEESWKDYSKQLEQHRLETTMQNRIRVHEGARIEQGFDPDMPPELAAAAGGHNVPAENANVGKPDAGQGDSRAALRPPVPMGRPIQVETGSAERLPSTETRQQRIRDADSVIEIDCGAFFEDNSSKKQDTTDQDKSPRGSVNDDHNAEKEGHKNYDTSPEKEPLRRAVMESTPDRVPERTEVSPLHREGSTPSRSATPVSGRSNGIPSEKRTPVRSTHRASPHQSPPYSSEDKKSVDEREGSIESMGGKSVARESSLEQNDVSLVRGDGIISEVEKKASALDLSLKDDEETRSGSKEKHYLDDSKAGSGSSRDHQKLHDGNEDEVSGRSNQSHRDKSEKEYRRNHERSRPMVKLEGLDRRMERDRDDDPQGRKVRGEDTRKRDHVDDVGSRHRSRGRESERVNKEEYVPRKEMDNGVDYRSKRRKDEVVDKEETPHNYRESTNRHKRERERDSGDEYYSTKHKNDISMHRERNEKLKNREGLSKPRQSHEDVPKQRTEDKSRSGYHVKDTSRHGEQQPKHGADESVSVSHHRGRDDVREEKRSRQERLGSQGDRYSNVSNKQKTRRESTRKTKEPEDGDSNAAAVASKRNQPDQTDRVDATGLASSDEEQTDSRRGRSKLERWGSHKEEDFAPNSKQSSSLKLRDVGRSSSNGRPKEYPKPKPSLEAVAEEKDPEAGSKPAENRHLDTVEKLKKRSERFKLPMPSEKEPQAVKMIENEAVPSAKTEASADTETKHERPARKRRWVSS